MMLRRTARRAWLRGASVPCAVAWLVVLAGCNASYPEGKFACETTSECPAGWYCLGAAGKKRCYSSEDALSSPGGGDAGADAGARSVGGAGRAIVAGGGVVESARYRYVVTTGQVPGGKGIQTSTRYEFRGGFVGATQSIEVKK